MYYGKAYFQALGLLRRPGARLASMRTHSRKTGGTFAIAPGTCSANDEVAKATIARIGVQPFDEGLLPDCPQSWCYRRRP